MKKIYSLFLTIIVLCSCSDDDQNSPQLNVQGKWQLIEMTGSIPDSQATGGDMDWQEFYVLNLNRTFKKSRERDGVFTEIFGTYRIVKSSDQNYLDLNYDSESDIIGGCFAEPKESMFFQSDSVFLSTWSSCDGPGLKYEKVN